MQSEYYLTDMIEIIKREESINVDILNIDTERMIEIIGVNTIQQLRELEELIKNKKIETEKCL
jgi:bifunctional N-acetylglucosamine-1-phosphate-uridyltransferase/glucosamine-1-phosphate-acetyltransferase GlmU-like protein